MFDPLNVWSAEQRKKEREGERREKERDLIFNEILGESWDGPLT